MRMTSSYWRRARMSGEPFLAKGGPVRLTRSPAQGATVTSGPKPVPGTGVNLPPPAPPAPLPPETYTSPVATQQNVPVPGSYRPMGVNQALMQRVGGFGGAISMAPGAISAPAMMGRSALPKGAPFLSLGCGAASGLCEPTAPEEELPPPFRIG